MNGVIRHLLAACGRDGMTDEELLTCFLDGRDDNALAALVRRHGPMVWGVCCRLLRSHHDAEDAFQATFLVLVQKAATLPNRETIGNWLYGVARQTAVRMRAAAAKRGVRERQVTVLPEPTRAEKYVWNDLAPVLDEELSRLPDKYRVLIVLCDLEGMTRKDVARQLDLPEGTAASRLAAARAMLAKRLARRGIVVSFVLFGAVLPQQSAWASVPTTVIASTIKAATLVAAGKAAPGAISPTVAALITGVTNAMFMTKLKTGVVAVLVVGLTLAGIGAGVGFPTNPVAVAQQPGVQPPDIKPSDEAKKSGSKEPPKQGDKTGEERKKEPAVVTPEQLFRDKLTGPVRVEFTVANYNQYFPLIPPGDTTTPNFLDILEPNYNEGGIDTLQVYLPQKIAARFSQLGVENVRSHILGKVIRVSGTLRQGGNVKGGSSYSLWIESLDQFESISKKGRPPGASGPGRPGLPPGTSGPGGQSALPPRGLRVRGRQFCRRVLLRLRLRLRGRRGAVSSGGAGSGEK